VLHRWRITSESAGGGYLFSEAILIKHTLELTFKNCIHELLLRNFILGKNSIWTLAQKMTSFHFPEKVFVGLGLGLGLGLRLRLELAETRLNTFSVKRPFG